MRARFAWMLLGCAVACGAAHAPRAHAQAAPDVQLFNPAPGEVVAFSSAEPEVLDQGAVLAGVGASYARRVLVRTVDCAPDELVVDSSCLTGGGETPIVSDLAQLEAYLAVGVLDGVELGVAAPIALARVVDDVRAPRELQSVARFSDLRLSATATLLRGDFAAALALHGSFPTGDAERTLGSPGATLMPALVLRQRIAGISIAATAGYRMRERVALVGLEQDDELDLTLALAVPLADRVSLRAESHARLGVFGRSSDANEHPLESVLGAGFEPAPAWQLLGGFGTATWPGRRGYGAPAFRAVLALRHALGERECVRAAGCTTERAADPDGDRVAGAADECPYDAEDLDGFLDADGCPDLDDDADGLLDAEDACPRVSEDRDGHRDDDGCPDEDNDDDEVADADDACSMDPEDRDGFEDDDGCPEPGPEPVSVAVEEDRILVSERIYFEHDRDTIRSVSVPALDRVAEAARALPRGRVLWIEGHTEASGNPAYDLDVSYRRARAVLEHLRARGVPAERLRYRGHGATKPLASGNAQDARALNGRVEFVLE